MATCMSADISPSLGWWANRIAKWDGSAWSALGSGMSGWQGEEGGGAREGVGGGRSLCTGGERDQSLRWGMFTTAGGEPANNIGKWDGNALVGLGIGIGRRGLGAGG